MNKLLIFDLDGTLIDSVGGIANSVNRTLKKLDLPVVPDDVVAAAVGNGARKLLERICGDLKLPVSFEDALQIMLDFYADDPVCNTTLYPGVKDELALLQNNGWSMAIVSNKPQIISDKIIDKLDIRQFIVENIGGNSRFPLKPEPDAIYYLQQKYSASPEKTFMVGDNWTDIMAAENAGIKSVFCSFGIGVLQDQKPDGQINHFTELGSCLNSLLI